MTQPIRPYDNSERSGGFFGGNPEVALITRTDIVEACRDQKVAPDESTDAYRDFEAALEAALKDKKVKRDIEEHLLDALDDIVKAINERCEHGQHTNV